MSNIILIDEDDRVRRQMEMFLAELGEDNRIRSFKTLKEFESLYFRTVQAAAPKAPFESDPQLKLLDLDQQNWLLTQNFAKDSPFASTTLNLVIDKSTEKIKSADPKPSDSSKLFGIPLSNFNSQNNVIETLLPPPFKKTYADLLTKAKSGKVQTALIALYSATSEVWILQLEVSVTLEFLTLKLENLSDKFVDTIQKVKEKLEEPEDEDDELKLLSQIDLIILKAGFLPKKPTAWFDEFYAKLKKYKLHPPDYRSRLIVTKYEDEVMTKVDFTHPIVDDIIYLPLDRLIFLQKVEIILALPKTTSPSYLFSKEVKLEIEIAKRSWMEKLSDVALAIRNPVPLIPGLFGHFYIDLVGEKESIEVYGKVLRSEPHPTYKDEYLVYFSFFSLKKDIQSRLRKYLAKDNHYASLINSNKEDFSFNPDDLFTSDEDKRLKNVILMDSDPDSYDQILSILKEDVENIQVAAFNTYSAFLMKYFNENEVTIDLSQLQAALPKDVFGGQCTWVVNNTDRDLLDFSPPSLANSTLLGHESTALFNEKQDWKKLFSGADLESLLEEIFRITDAGRPFHSVVFFTDTTGKPKALDLKASSQPRGVQFTASIPKPEDVKNFVLLQNKFTNWDLLIIDASLLPLNPTEWITNIESNAKAKGYLKDGEKLKIIIVDHANSKRKITDYDASQVRAQVLRPVEPRSLLFNVSATLNLPYTVYQFSNIGWSNSRVAVQVAKNGELQSLAEFGAAIKHSRPIAPGTFLFLRGSIFDNAPRKNLCARFYSCEEDPAEKGTYICSLTYFGINEAFTKFARSWFRETYAASKQNEG